MEGEYHDFGDDQKLIDISKEDDDLLTHSPLFDSFVEDFRFSAATFDHMNDHESFKLSESQPSQEVENTVENLLQKEQMPLSSYDFVPARPSYLRQSLAWDNAFFTSSGVLDNDELTFINEGFKTTEMQLPSESCKRDAFSTASRNINIGIHNKTKTLASGARNITRQRSVKNKTECIYKRKESHSFPLKVPKVFSRMKNVLTGERSSASVDCQAKVKNNSATIGSGNNLKLSKISALENSCTLSGSLSLSEHSSVIASSANSHDRKSNASSIKVPSALLKRKAESTKSKLSDSRSTPNAAVRYLMKGKELGHPRFSTQSLSLSNNFSCISSSSLSKGSTLRPKSRAKQPSKDTEIHLDTPVTLRVTGSQDEEKQSPFLMNNLHIKSILYQQNEVVNSPDQPSTPSLTATSHVPTESRKKLKASCLRMPSPKIGFFDEDKSTVPTMGRSFQLHFEMQCTPHCKPGYSNRKLRPGKLVQDRTSSEIRCIRHVSRSTQLLHPAQDIVKPQHVTSDEKLKSSSPEVWSTMKSVSDVGLRFQSGTCGEIEEKICSKCRRVDQSSVIRQDDERRRVKGTHSRLSREAKGKRTDPVILPELSTPTKKEKNGCSQHDANNLHSSVVDQVNDISRYFEAMDLSRDMVMDNKEVDKDWPILHVDSIVSKSNGNDIVANDQKKQGMMPNTFSDSSSPSLPGTEFSPSLRTPLADKTSIGNRSGSLIQSTTKEKLAEKPSKFPCQDVPSYKENTCPI